MRGEISIIDGMYRLLLLMLLISVLLFVLATYVFPVTASGVVSSISSSNFGVCVSTMEFYGGNQVSTWCYAELNEVQPNQVCSISVHGLYLDKLECVNKTRGA